MQEIEQCATIIIGNVTDNVADNVIIQLGCIFIEIQIKKQEGKTMKTGKKVIAVVSATLMAAGLLAGCGSGDSAGSGDAAGGAGGAANGGGSVYYLNYKLEF